LTNEAMEGGMPIYNYALLALLTSGGHGLEGLTLTLGPDAIVQPKGGGLVLLAGETKKTIDVQSYSWGATNSGSSRIGSPTTRGQRTTTTPPTTGLSNPALKEGGPSLSSPKGGWDVKANKKM
jgi:hypothetical protein